MATVGLSATLEDTVSFGILLRSIQTMHGTGHCITETPVLALSTQLNIKVFLFVASRIKQALTSIPWR